MDKDAAFAMRDRGESAELSAAIAAIYDCVFDHAAWPAALSAVVRLVGGCAASLTSHALPGQSPERFAEFGTDPSYSRAYISKYGLINPLFAMSLLDMAEGEAGTLYQAVDLRAFHRTRFYREWVRPQGWGDWLALVLTRSPTRLSLVAVARQAAAGPFSPEQVRFANLLTPHLQRAAALGRVLDRRAEREAGLAALLDRIAVAALLVASDGRIAFANAAAQALLADGGLLAREPGGLLRLADPAARRRLREAIVGALASPDVLVIDTAAGKRVVSILPATAESGGFVVMLVTRPEAVQPPPGPILKSAYGLTPAELRVLALLTGGRTAADIAGELGVTPRTVKAHLQKLFQKTGVARQSDLIREVMRLAPPFG